MDLENLEKYREKTGIYASKEGDLFGLFFVPVKGSSTPLKVLCAPMSDQWQHVSVSLPFRCPTWPEMVKIKNLFWNEDETVIQFHPKKSEYINCHPHCLHLWRRTDAEIQLPPSILVGVCDR